MEPFRARFDGIAFNWHQDLYGLALPGLDGDGACAIARELQAAFGAVHTKSLTVGIAPFPHLDFTRTAVFRNACKALDHASFFGAGGLALFDAVSLNISGDHCYQQGDLQGAMAEYNCALRLDPNDVNVHNSLGVCQARCNNLNEAVRSFETVLRLQPDEVMAVFNLGVVHLMMKDQVNALDYFKKAWGLDEGRHYEIALALSKLLCELGHFDQARPVVDAALALRADSAQALTLLGQCLTACGQENEALAAFRRAVKLNPNDAAALSGLAELYAAMNENSDICLTFGRQSVALAPENSLYHYRLGRLYEKFDQLDSALSEYERALELGYAAAETIEALRRRIAADEPRQCAG